METVTSEVCVSRSVNEQFKCDVETAMAAIAMKYRGYVLGTSVSVDADCNCIVTSRFRGKFTSNLRK